MNTIQNLFQQAQPAEAAYADLTGIAGLSGTSTFEQRLQDEGFSTAQATAFVAQWRVVDHIPDTASGFSATVFEKLDANGNGTGQYSLAPRGTQGGVDLVQADLKQIVMSGVAYSQIVDTYNYWQSLNAAAGSTYQAAQVQTLTTETQMLFHIAQTGTQQEYDAYKAQLQSNGYIVNGVDGSVNAIISVNSSLLADASLQQGRNAFDGATVTSLDVAGHSLGFHLGAAFSRLFPGTDVQVDGVNGAGFNNSNPNVNNLFSALGGAAQFDATRIHNVIGSAGLNFISQDWPLLEQPGTRQEIVTGPADIIDNTLGHGVGLVRSALGALSAAAALDPTYSTANDAAWVEQLTQKMKLLDQAFSMPPFALLDNITGDAYPAFLISVNASLRQVGDTLQYSMGQLIDELLATGHWWGDFIFLYENGTGSITDRVSAAFMGAQRFIPRRDPLTLDLNGNGLETLPINATSPIYFDLEGSGVQSSVGWVAPNDGFLVLDRNGDGIVNDGTELFGDATPLLDADGNVVGKAADGFDALAAQDTNADGVVNSSDTNFANLRVWQDLNQDGISQANELKTLGELGIASFNVANVNHSQLLANGNQIADTGSYTRTDGSTGTAGVTAGMADINLAVDTFHRTFADTIPLTPQTETLPDMQGSGAVRDLREAASIQTAEGTALADALAKFPASTTRNTQRAQLDTLLTDWAASADFEDMATQAAAHGYGYTSNLSIEWQHKLAVLETFNGRSFFHMPWDSTNAQSGVTGMSISTDATGHQTIHIAMNGTQLALLDQAYNALKESVYDALIPQTRLKPYLDNISLALDANGTFRLNFSAVGCAANDGVWRVAA